MYSNSGTIHIRLTKKCNADCDYCSSYQEKTISYMTPDDIRKSVNFILDNYWNNKDYLTVEYVGGEILLVPPKKLNEIVGTVREILSSRGIKFIDGMQSNLIASIDRLNNAKQLFNDKISTSIDDISDQRKISGSNTKYNNLTKIGQKIISSDKKVPAVFTVDKKNYNGLLDQYRSCNEEKRNITVRHVFGGGKDVDLLTSQQLTSSYTKLFTEWFLNSDIICEPFFSLTKKIANKVNFYDPNEINHMCPFQSDCSDKSVAIEPNGDIFVCQELADANRIILGNAIRGELHEDNIRMFKRRKIKLDQECYRCDFFHECQGGCAMESLQFGNGVYGRSEYCSTWKVLFLLMNKKISENPDKALIWIKELEKNTL